MGLSHSQREDLKAQKSKAFESKGLGHPMLRNCLRSEQRTFPLHGYCIAIVLANFSAVMGNPACAPNATDVGGTCTCNAGFFGNGTECTICPTGTFQPDSGMLYEANCTMCGLGKYSTKSGMTACDLCGPGKYQTGTGMTLESACADCAAGTYSALAGAIDDANCSLCGPGKYSTGLGFISEGNCTLCGKGTYQSGTGMPTEANCTMCEPGHYQTGVGMPAAGGCTPCPAGAYQTAAGAANASACAPCGAGKYQPAPGAGNASDCLDCSAGRFQTGRGMAAEGNCTPCGAGTYSTAAGAANGSACAACAAGTFQTGLGMADPDNCTLCAAGTYGPRAGAADAAACAPCPAGTYATGLGAAAAACEPCGPGTYQSGLGAANDTDCTLCAAGTYQTGGGMPAAANCTPCPAGTYGTSAGAAAAGECAPCGPGTYQSAPGAAAADCTPCPAGTYQTGSAVPAAAGCAPCAAGTYSTAEAATAPAACGRCPLGYYVPAAGAASPAACQPCPPPRTGFYSTCRPDAAGGFLPCTPPPPAAAGPGAANATFAPWPAPAAAGWGTSNWSECVLDTLQSDACPTACADGYFRPADAADTAPCRRCSSAPCPAGYYRSACGYADLKYNDSECRPCSNILAYNSHYSTDGGVWSYDGTGTLVLGWEGSCDWACNDGYYMHDAVPLFDGCTGNASYLIPAIEGCFRCTNAPAHAHYTGPGPDYRVDRCPWACDEGYVTTDDGEACAPLAPADRCAAPAVVAARGQCPFPMLAGAAGAAGNGTGGGNLSGAAAGVVAEVLCMPWEYVACGGGGALECRRCEGFVETYAGGWPLRAFEPCPAGRYRAPCSQTRPRGCVYPDHGLVKGQCVPCTNALTGNFTYTAGGDPPFSNNCAWECLPGFRRATVAVRDQAGCARFTREQCVPAT